MFSRRPDLSLLLLALSALLAILLAAATPVQASLIPHDFKLEALEHKPDNKTSAAFNSGYRAFKDGQLFEAIKHFKKAADAGEMKAQTNLAELYHWGWSLVNDDDTWPDDADKLAKAYYLMAAEQGDAAALMGIGRLHEPRMGGNLEPSTLEHAISWYEKAAIAGYQRAKDDLYGIYTSDTSFNTRQALRWSDWKSAYKGNVVAQLNLALLFWQATVMGQEGMDDGTALYDRPLVTSMKWLEIARQHPDREARNRALTNFEHIIANIERDTPEKQKEEARRLAAVCIQSDYSDCPIPMEADSPAPVGDWYAIAGAFQSEAQARRQAEKLGSGWTTAKTDACPNFTPGYWITTTGAVSKSRARQDAARAKRFRAYAKKCH